MTDVVTAAGQRWSRDPFAAELVDGVVWGRGALDRRARSRCSSTPSCAPRAASCALTLFSMIDAADEHVPADAVRFGAEAVGPAVERYAG